MTMVRWIVLLLAVVFSYDVQCIKVKVDSNFFENTTKQLQNATSIFGDSQLSASERNRRLIPYMAFYVPASDLPINEKYLAQRTKGLLSGENPNSQTGEVHIPVPPTYMHLKAPEPNEADLAYVNNYNQQKLSNHPYHQSIIYHDSNPEKDVNKKLSPVYQLLPPAPAPASAPSPTAAANAMLLPPAYVPHKHKTIQHFPPTTAETRYQQTAPQLHPQQPQQSVIYRERPKQSKNNFTPFTESNTLPGHFVPIIYTNKHNTNDDEDFKPRPTQEQTRFKNVPQKLPQKQIDTNDYVLQQQQPTAHEQEPHIYLTVTASPAPLTGEPVQAEHQTASPIYQLTNQQQQQPAKTFHSSLKLQQQQNRHQHRQPATHHTHFQSMKIENLYAQQVDAQFPQYSNGDFVTTPQEKYVVYLQQPVHANRPQQQQQHQQQVQQHNLQASTSVNGNRQPPQQQQQQQQQQQKEIIYSKEQRDHTKQQYVKQHRFSHPIFVSSTPTTPHNHESPEEIHINYGQQQPPVRHATYQPRPELLLTPPQQQSAHILYTHAKTNSPKQQQHLHHIRQQKQQKDPETPHEEIYFNIPVRNMFENIANQHHHHHSLAHQSEHNSHTSALAPTYIEYVIDEPKQSLEEETHQTAHPPTPATSEPTSTTDPRDAYILVTTASPYRSSQMHRPEHQYGSTVRPLHKERKPTLRLQPIEHSPASLGYYPKYTTMQPKPFKTQQQNQAKYIYVSTKPTYTQLLYAKPTMAIKVKPDYAYVTPNTLEDHTPKQDTQLSKDYPVAAVEKQTVTNYVAKVDDSAENELPDIRSSSLEEILHKLQASNHLPHTLTPENIDNSIKTLITILNNLKNTQSIVPSPPQHHVDSPSHKYTDDDYTTGSDEILPPASHHLNSLGPNKHPGPSTGRAGVDFPNYAAIPQTSFDCHTQRYKGFFGDPETNCQVWHYCDLNGGKASFLCPNGTIFSQIALTCDWWFNVKCSTTTQLYVLNERLYKYILPFTPKFPEDYSGPLVDKYLAMKYQEMEEKMRAEKSKATEQANEVDSIANNNKDDAAVEVTTHQSDEMKQAAEPNIQHNLVNDADTDDISNRGTIDTYEIVTQRQPETVTAADEMPPLSVKPIVVSSTIEPEFDAEMYETLQQEQNTSSSSVELQQTANLHRPITNITVEKVEVIEIKTDGTTGHLAPDNQAENKE